MIPPLWEKCREQDLNLRTPTGQRPERCAVGQTWLSLRAIVRFACPVKPLSVLALGERAVIGSGGVCWGIVSLQLDCVFQFGRAVTQRLDRAQDQFLGGERPVRLDVEHERVGHVRDLDVLAGVAVPEVVVELVCGD